MRQKEPQITFTEIVYHQNINDNTSNDTASFRVDTNYPIDKEFLNLVSEIDGVSGFMPFGPYEAIFRPGRLFDPESVKIDIRRAYRTYYKSVAVDELNRVKIKKSFIHFPNGERIEYNSSDPTESSIATNISNGIKGITSSE